MSQLEIWNNPLLTMELRLEVAVAEIEKLRQQLATVTAERNEAAKPVVGLSLLGEDEMITFPQVPPVDVRDVLIAELRSELAAVTKELQAADDELNDFAECIAINRMYERQIAELREALEYCACEYLPPIAQAKHFVAQAALAKLGAGGKGDEMNEQSIVMRWQNAESAVARLGMKIEVSTDFYRVVNAGNASFAGGANWSFSTLDGLLGWVSGIDLGRMMK